MSSAVTTDWTKKEKKRRFCFYSFFKTRLSEKEAFFTKLITWISIIIIVITLHQSALRRLLLNYLN